jgi:hypothetical protein
VQLGEHAKLCPQISSGTSRRKLKFTFWGTFSLPSNSWDAKVFF